MTGEGRAGKREGKEPHFPYKSPGSATDYRCNSSN